MLSTVALTTILSYQSALQGEKNPLQKDPFLAEITSFLSGQYTNTTHSIFDNLESIFMCLIKEMDLVFDIPMVNGDNKLIVAHTTVSVVDVTTTCTYLEKRLQFFCKKFPIPITYVLHCKHHITHFVSSSVRDPRLVKPLLFQYYKALAYRVIDLNPNTAVSDVIQQILENAGYPHFSLPLIAGEDVRKFITRKQQLEFELKLCENRLNLFTYEN